MDLVGTNSNEVCVDAGEAAERLEELINLALRQDDVVNLSE
jgi:hypothetical protein